MFRVAARHHASVHVHIRGGMPGLEEVIAGTALTGAPLHIVHINSSGLAQTREMLQMVAEAQSRGLDVTTEAYPYSAGMTEIQSANYDGWEQWPPERFANLEWPKTGERLTRDTFVKYRKVGGPVIGHSNTDEMVAVAILEGAATADAAARLSPQDLQELRAIASEMEQVGQAGDPIRFSELNRRWHAGHLLTRAWPLRA